jgi:adenylate cyclase
MNEEQARRKLAAILSADVEGYSRLMADDEEATVRTITSFREFITNLIQKQNGRVADAKGDNILAEFASVVDAVRCAVEIQRGLKKRNSELPDHRKMEFRIGINLGDIIEDKETIYGDGVNIAARLEGLSHPGGICISGTVCDHVKNKLDLGYEYLGEQTIKNIPEPVRVYRVLVEPETVGKVIGEKRFLGKISRRTAITAIIILVIVAGGLIGWNIYLQQSKKVEPSSLDKMAYPLPDKPSIAVLPFDNLTGDPAQEYFSDGITEEIITALSKVPKLFVIARSSTFTYKGKPVKIKQVSEELGVRYVLEGTVRKVENKVRITAQLIDAIKGYHLWADRYNRDLKDLFAIQDEITKNIITSIQVKLTAGEQAYLIAEGTKNLDAYLNYLQAWNHLRHFNKEDNMKARQLAEKTIALDPDFEKGYYVLAFVEIVDIWIGASKSPKDSLMRCIELAKKSIAIKDSSLPHRLLATTYVLLRKHSAAIEEARKAVEMAPNYADAYMTLGHVYMLSDMGEEAVPVLQKAIRLNPYPPSPYFHNLAWSYYLLGKYNEAIAEAKKAIGVSPKDVIAHRALICSYLSLGREEEARAHAAEVLRIDPTFSVDRTAKTSPFKNKDKLKKIMDSHRKAGLK